MLKRCRHVNSKPMKAWKDATEVPTQNRAERPKRQRDIPVDGSRVWAHGLPNRMHPVPLGGVGALHSRRPSHFIDLELQFFL